MVVTEELIASRVAIRRRYVRSVNLARDADDPGALDGYVVTPSVRDAAVRVLAGLSAESRQRAFRVVGPYGAGKSAFGVFLTQLFRERFRGPAMALLAETIGDPIDIAPWRPSIVSGRRVSFARELLRVVIRACDEACVSTLADLRAKASLMLDKDTAFDACEVTVLIAELAAELRSRTGEGLLLLIDEMGRFLEYSAANIGTEDPSIFQLLAEQAGGRAGADVAVIGFLHHRFADYVAGMGSWIEEEWSRSSERYEELSFGGTTEQSLFMLARALEPTRPHKGAVRRRAEEIYGEAVDRSLFVVPRDDVVEVAPNLYPLHPAAVASLASAMRRFGQNERSLFSFLQSMEPASLQRFALSNLYCADHWYLVPSVLDHLAATLGERPGGNHARRWSLAFDALAVASDLPSDHRDVLKTVALVGVLEPVPGLSANAETIAWSLGIDEDDVMPILDELTTRNLIYRRPHRGDYSLWSSSSVDLSRWLDEARIRVRAPQRLEDISYLMTSSRPAVAHRHYHETGTLRTFEILLWTGKNIGSRSADGLILVAPVYPGEDRMTVLNSAAAAVSGDPLALVCARTVALEDLKWAHELTLWNWVRDNCDDLKVDELARVEVDERIAAAERAMVNSTALLSSICSGREETWWFSGKPVSMPSGGLSALLSNICDIAYNQAPILKNELINRVKLSSAVASARTRLLGRMLTCSDQAHLGIEGSPPERTIYLSLFQASGIHAKDIHGGYFFRAPGLEDPCQWRPVWERIVERLDDGKAMSFAALMEDLAAPPYGLRAAPALLAITAFILASRDQIAVLERNSFQPDLTTAHFMRLAKSPAKFALQCLREDAKRIGVVQALATRLTVTGPCRPTVVGVSEKLFAWYNSLPTYALKTASVSPNAVSLRSILRKASEPGSLFFHDLPSACGAVTQDGSIDIECLVESLNGALLELNEATQRIRSQATRSALHAFGTKDLVELRSQIDNDYKPHRKDLKDYRLRVFVERATNMEASPDRWLDGIAGHLVGRRPANWADDTLDKFDFEVRVVAGNLARWLALAKTKQPRSADLRSVHVVAINGPEHVVVVRRDRPNPLLESRLNAVRKALENDPRAVEVLGQLLAEYADNHIAPHKGKKVGTK